MREVTLFHGRSLASCYVGMLVIGLLLSVYGPIAPMLQGRFEISGAAVGTALGTQSFGAVVGVLFAQSVLRARGNRETIMAALLLIAVGSTIIALAPVWPLLLLGTAVAGLGFGGVDSLVTQLILVGSGSKGPGRANIAHAWFGIGTVAGPVLIYLVGPGNYAWVFTGTAIVTVIALISASGLAPRPLPSDVTAMTRVESAAPMKSTTVTGLVIATFFALYLTHFAVQAGIGNWAPTVMEKQSGLTAHTATLFISGFWAAMVIGRFAAALLTRYISAGLLVTVSSSGLVTAVAATTVQAAAPWAYLLAGAFLGPIFPTGLAWLSATGYGRGNTFAYVIAGSMIGMGVAPSLVGWVIEGQGSHAAPFVLLALSTLVAVSSVSLLALTARARRQMPHGPADSSPRSQASVTV